MRKTALFFFLIPCIFLSCKSETKTSASNSYLRWVGDIEQNEELDDLSFKTCHGDENVLQYFNLGQGPVYKGEKSAIIQTFQSQYKTLANSNDSGLIRIRFIVNCEGKAARFRVLQSNFDYQEKEFDEQIVSQLLNITKQIEDWAILYREETPADYYMYLIFKIDDGELIEILP